MGIDIPEFVVDVVVDTKDFRGIDEFPIGDPLHATVEFKDVTDWLIDLRGRSDGLVSGATR